MVNIFQKYYNKEHSSYSFKSYIHPNLNYGFQIPNRLWKLIKEYMIFTKDQCKLCNKASSRSKGILIDDGIILSFPYYDKIFNSIFLTSLELSSNKITNITALGNALATNTSLEILMLDKNQITDITALGNALVTNASLTYLGLRDNLITNITSLGNALVTNTTLKDLCIYNNRITNIRALGNALATNSTLGLLMLNGNQITDITPLSNALATNTILKILWLSEYLLTREDNEIIKTAWKRRDLGRLILNF
jgi:Leucine-rich repeat (LRR) protein